MIPKHNRGITGREIVVLRRFGERKSLRFGMIWWQARSSEALFSRIAVAVSAQHIPKAVARNRVRRNVQALLIPILSQLEPPYDVFIHIRSAALPDQQALQKEITAILTSTQRRRQYMKH